MRFTQLGSLAALAGFSQAFLIPSTISTADVKIVEAVPFEVEAALEGRVLEVNCPRCPVDGSEAILRHADSILRFNVSIEHGDDSPDLLMVNGLQVFPVDPQATTAKSLSADQLVKRPDGTWGYSSSPELGYSMSVKPFHDGKQQLSVYGIHLRVIEVGTTFVRGIPAIDLKVLKTPSGKLMIASGQVGAGRVPTVHKPQCPSLLCHWKAAIANKVEALKKGCGSKQARPHKGPRPHGGHREGGHRRPHHHPRPHQNSFGRFVQSLVLHVLMPILIGVALGITASLVGMVVGHTAIFFWRLFFRRGERGQYCRVKQQEVVGEANEESKTFLENQGPPPVYEDAVVVVDEKTEQV